MVQINDLLEGEIPEAMYERQIDDEIRAFNYRLQSQGLKFDTYMQLTGQNAQTLRQGFRRASGKSSEDPFGSGEDRQVERI